MERSPLTASSPTSQPATAAEERTGRTPKTPRRMLRRLRPRVTWMAALFAATCFEGLGRKFLPFLPATFFYFLKDGILLFGLLVYGVRRDVLHLARDLVRPFFPVIVCAVVWTIVEMFNPDHQSFALALIGLRAYWLWWIAPLVIASAIEDVKDYRGVVVVLALISVVVALFAVDQFRRPADDPMNTYALYEGRELIDAALVGSTGRARVSSTFAYITGFTDYVTLIPPLLLAIGLNQDGRVRTLAMIGTIASVAVMPASGSRGPVVMGALALLAVAWGSGLLRTRLGRRIAVGGAVAIVAGLFLMPEAVQGVSSRFTEDPAETWSRITGALSFIPIIPLMDTQYTAFGLGTGMQHNARFSMGVLPTPWDTEPEFGRYLVELGPVGYLLVWLARVALIVALVRAALRLRRAGQGGFAGLALAYAALTTIGTLMVDHVWCAIEFTGIGLVLRAVMQLPAAAPAPPVRARPLARLARLARVASLRGGRR